jgi:acetyl esterase/lipase
MSKTPDSVRGATSITKVTSHRSHGHLRRHYGPVPDQHGDLHVSRSDPERGTLVLFHGGFWRPHRTLSMTRPVAEALADAGWNVWNVEYRRHGRGTWQQTLQDCADAVDHLAVLGEELALDLTTTLVVGHSAGAQAAAWVTARAMRTGSPLRIDGLVTLNGVVDLGLAAELGIGNHAVDEFLGADSTALDQTDPVRRLPLGVPARCLHGRDDERVPFTIGEEFVALARAAGDDVELREIPGGHTAPIEPHDKAWAHVLDALNDPWPGRFAPASAQAGARS